MDNTSFGLGLLAGTAIGSIVTFFITRHVLQSDFDKRSEDIATYYKQNYSQPIPQPVSVATPSPEPVQESVPEVPKEEPMPNPKGDIYTISVDDYTKTGNPGVEVFIYTDGVITAGDNKITINEAYDILGAANFRELASSTSPVIYIRNNITDTDYRVEQCLMDYYDDDMDDTD